MMVSAPSTPAPSSVTAPPKSTCRFPVASWRSTRVVLPAKVTPSIGVTCHSAAAMRGAARRHRPQAARILNMRGPALDRKAQEQRGEEGPRHITRRQLERRAEPVAVGEEDERQIAFRQLQDERRIAVLHVAEVPHDALPAIELHEPPEPHR